MSRRNFNDGQELIFEDMNAITSTVERSLYDRVVHELIQRVDDAFFGDSLRVLFSTPTQINVSAGLGFQLDATQVAPEPTKRPLYLGSSQATNISTPDGANDRIDIVVVDAALVDEISANRKFKDAITEDITTVSLVVGRDWEANIQIIAGTPAASPVAPATPVGTIKIAEYLVTAVTGIANQAAITDTRDAIPFAGDTLLDTSTLVRVTAGVNTPLSTIIADIDALLFAGLQEYTDYTQLGAAPGNPAAGTHRLYNLSGNYFTKDSAGAVNPIGSGGGGGGGGANWTGDTLTPIETIENNEKVFLYEQDAGQTLSLFVFVPSGYIAGRQISMFLGLYSPAAANAFRLQSTSTLIRKDVDAISSAANQETAAVASTNTVVDQLRRVQFDLTTALGEINGFAVSAGDLIKVDLDRPTDAGDTDTEDTRFLPSATEVKFG